MENKHPIWGIDLGGTKIEGIVLPALGEYKPIVRIRVETEAHLGYQHVLGQINKLVEEMKSQSGLVPQSIGIGTPGEVDPITQKVKNSNSTHLNGMFLKRDMEAMLKVPVVVANDANCFALAETHWGVVKEKFPDSRVAFGVIMGTGVGGGIVIDGKIWNGKHGIAGEWGHNFLDDSGGKCYCGKMGCVETVISGPATERYYTSLTGKQLPLKEIAELNGKEEAASKAIQRLCYFFGKAISVVINILDPDVIVIGGGVGNVDALYTDGLVSLRQFIFNDRVDVPIVEPSLGDSAGVFGAAALVH